MPNGLSLVFSMTNFKMTHQVTCKMTNCTLKITDLLITLKPYLPKHLNFHVVFNKTLRVSKASRAREAREAGEVSKQVQAHSLEAISALLRSN